MDYDNLTQDQSFDEDCQDQQNDGKMNMSIMN